MIKSYIVFGNENHTAKEVAALQRLSFEDCILIDDEEHARELINNSPDLIHVRMNTPRESFNKPRWTKQ